MEKPEYELEPLKAGVIQSDENILAFRKAILKEETRKQEYQKLITKWEEYNGNSSRPDS